MGYDQGVSHAPRRFRSVTPEKLRQLYEADVAVAVADPRAPREDRLHLSYLLAWSRRTPAGGFAPRQDDSGVWFWSDLHLGHVEMLSVFGRPFRSPEEMDDALFEAWEHFVDPADTIVFLGDVAIGGLSGRRLKRFRAPRGEESWSPATTSSTICRAGTSTASTRPRARCTFPGGRRCC